MSALSRADGRSGRRARRSSFPRLRAACEPTSAPRRPGLPALARLAAAAGAIALTLASGAAAAEGGPDLAAATSVREFDEELKGAIAAAFRTIDEGDPVEGVAELVRALAACTDQVAPYGKVVFLNQRHAAILSLLDRGPKARDAFESVFGARAAEALEDGTRRRDPRSLLEAAYLYLPAEKGQLALVAAADLLAEEGRLDESAERLRQLLWFVPPDALRVDPARVLARLARAYSGAGEPARLAELAALAAERFPAALEKTIDAGGRSMKIADLLRRGANRESDGSGADWPAFGGGDARRFAAESLDLGPVDSPARLEPVWIYRHRSTIDPESPAPSPPAESAPTVFSSRENPVLPVLPVVADGVVYFADRAAVFAVDAETGLTLWVTELGRAAATRAAGKRPLAPRGRPYHYVTVADSRSLLVVPSAGGADPLAPARRLARLDRLTGAIDWESSAAPGDDDGADFLSRAVLTGPPVVVGSLAFVGARLIEVECKAYVAAFSLETGHLAFRTFLASGPENERRDENEPETPSISESGGVLYVSTDLGVLAAVDARTGDPLWIYRPERQPDLLFESRDAWRDDPLAILGDRLHSTLPGSDKIRLVFDRPERGTGNIENEHWEKNDLDFLLGADAGWLFLVGRDEEDRDSVLIAYHPADEATNEQWRFTIPNPAERKGAAALDLPLGRGLVTRDRVLLPTWKALYDLDRTTGRVLAVHAPATDSETRASLPFGNLLPLGRERLLAAGPRHLVLYRIAR